MKKNFAIALLACLTSSYINATEVTIHNVTGMNDFNRGSETTEIKKDDFRLLKPELNKNKLPFKLEEDDEISNLNQNYRGRNIVTVGENLKARVFSRKDFQGRETELLSGSHQVATVESIKVEPHITGTSLKVGFENSAPSPQSVQCISFYASESIFSDETKLGEVCDGKLETLHFPEAFLEKSDITIDIRAPHPIIKETFIGSIILEKIDSKFSIYYMHGDLNKSYSIIEEDPQTGSVIYKLFNEEFLE